MADKPVFAWPVDEDGKPMALISMGAAEKVGLPNYSNVDIGPAVITRFVKDEPAVIEQSMRDAVHLCETIISTEREIVQRDIKR